MNKNDEVKEPSTPMFRSGRKGKSLIGKRLHKNLPSEEPEVLGSSTCENSTESGNLKLLPPSKTRQKLIGCCSTVSLQQPIVVERAQ